MSIISRIVQAALSLLSTTASQTFRVVKIAVFLGLGIAVVVSVTDVSLSFISRKAGYQIQGVEKLPDLKPYGTMPSNPKLPPVFKLGEVERKGKLDAFCTAFVIDANYALTAGHCLVNESGFLSKKKMYAMAADDTDLKVELTAAAVNNRMDVGLIRGNFNNFMPLDVDFYTFSPGMIKAGYMTCGFPYGQRKLTCVPFVPNAPNYFSIGGQGFLVPGMSGGPLIDITHGFALGINSSVDAGHVNISSTIGQLGAFGIEPPPQPKTPAFVKPVPKK